MNQAVREFLEALREQGVYGYPATVFQDEEWVEYRKPKTDKEEK